MGQFLLYGRFKSNYTKQRHFECLYCVRLITESSPRYQIPKRQVDKRWPAFFTFGPNHSDTLQEQGFSASMNRDGRSHTMRLSQHQQQTIRRIVGEVFEEPVTILLFGSRVDDDARGGDIDLLVQCSKPVAHPAVTASRLSTRISRALQGRKVDVVLEAPSLQYLPIHDVAHRTGVPL